MQILTVYRVRQMVEIVTYILLLFFCNLRIFFQFFWGFPYFWLFKIFDFSKFLHLYLFHFIDIFRFIFSIFFIHSYRFFFFYSIFRSISFLFWFTVKLYEIFRMISPHFRLGSSKKFFDTFLWNDIIQYFVNIILHKKSWNTGQNWIDYVKRIDNK